MIGPAFAGLFRLPCTFFSDKNIVFLIICYDSGRVVEQMEIVLCRIWCLVIGALLDLILGDPQGWPHLIRLIGRLCAGLEKRFLQEADDGRRKRRRGQLLVVVMLFLCGGVTFIGLAAVYHIHIVLGIAVESIVFYQMLSMKDLKTESMKVCQALEAEDVEQARQAVSMIVGRDTARLDKNGIARAAVETVAENTSDGVIAPLLYLTLGGGVLGVLYKAVNTMDSMIGYKSDRYLDFGRCAARLDDVVNFVPSRLAAWLMIIGTALCKLFCNKEERKNALLYHPGRALRIYRRDCRKHASPNSAQTEAVCAGALGLRIAGDAWYFGRRVEKPYIGDDLRPVEAADIRRANRLLYVTSLLMWLLCMGVPAGMVFWVLK